MTITIWTVTTDNNYGMQTSVHTTERDAYRVLVHEGRHEGIREKREVAVGRAEYLFTNEMWDELTELLIGTAERRESFSVESHEIDTYELLPKGHEVIQTWAGPPSTAVEGFSIETNESPDGDGLTFTRV